MVEPFAPFRLLVPSPTVDVKNWSDGSRRDGADGEGGAGTGEGSCGSERVGGGGDRGGDGAVVVGWKGGGGHGHALDGEQRHGTRRSERTGTGKRSARKQ